jgi:hypothetical protein
VTQHTHHVERVESDTGAGTATGMIVGILLVLLVAILALFFFFGGPARFAGSSANAPAPAGQTNVNVPQNGPPQGQSGPNIQVPRQIDVNVNQPPAQQAPAAPQAPSGGQSAPAPAGQPGP